MGLLRSVTLLVTTGLLAVLCAPVQATMLLQYTFDESASGNNVAIDSVVPAANGSFIGTATRTGNTPGGFSLGALDMTNDANNDYVSAADPAKLDGLTALTLTTWINLQANPATNDRLLSKLNTTGTGAAGFDWSFTEASAANFKLRFGIGDGSSYLAMNSSVTVNADHQWVFLAAVWDGTTLRYYRGDESSAPTQLGTDLALVKSTTGDNSVDFRVGSVAATTGDRTPPAWMDDVRVYNTALSVAELEAVRLEAVPEPSTWALLVALAGAVALGALRQRRA